MKARFWEVLPAGDAKHARLVASMETLGGEIPFQFTLDNWREVSDLRADHIYEADLLARGERLQVFDSEEDLAQSGAMLAAHAVIPLESSPLPGDGEGYHQWPRMLFSGVVVQAAEEPVSEEGGPNFRLKVHALELDFELLAVMEETPVPGNIVRGIGFLSGNIHPKKI